MPRTTKADVGRSWGQAIVAVPVMCVLMLMGVNERSMGQFVITPLWRFLGWFATILMAAGAGAFLLTLLPFRAANAS